MMIINIEIEFHRINPNTKVLALHSGIINTKVIEPLSKNVAPEKPFRIEYSVNCLLEVIKNTEWKPRGGFYVWDKKEIAWYFFVVEAVIKLKRLAKSGFVNKIMKI